METKAKNQGTQQANRPDIQQAEAQTAKKAASKRPRKQASGTASKKASSDLLQTNDPQMPELPTEIEKIINLTPSTVVLMDAKGAELVVFPSEGLATVIEDKSVHLIDYAGGPVDKAKGKLPIGTINNISIDGLPPEKPGIYFILTPEVFNAAKLLGRTDICYPAGFQIKNDRGFILGYEFLSFSNT